MSLLAAAAALVSVVLPAPAAVAQPGNPPCPAVDYDFSGGNWEPSNGVVAGVRAPIKIRKDGLLCSNTQHDSFVAIWIGIGQMHGDHLAQIGFDHHYNKDGNPIFCRFWAIGTGFPHYYNCKQIADDTSIFFKIESFQAGTSSLYKIQDCGTGGDFSNCTTENATQAAFGSARGETVSETDHGCASFMLGATSDKVIFGNSNWRLVGNNGATWGPRAWDLISPRCSSDYSAASTSNGIDTWDPRNAG
ncbi:MAG TPA: hypothetical protein VH637_17810 [Streptosporangiaceae bacterium]|jgi:hypothetical protein